VDGDQDKLLTDFTGALQGMGLEDLRGLAGQLLTIGGTAEPAAVPSRRRPPLAEVHELVLRAELVRSRPPIWRELRVRSDLTLDLLHEVLQAAFGWTDSHLHRFSLGGDAFSRDAVQFLCPFDVEEGDDEDGVPASQVRLDETVQEVGDVLHYCYDYGDNWDLTLTLQATGPFDPAAVLAVCTGGQRAAPPEDCGGLRTAAELSEVLPDPAVFDLAETASAVAQRAEMLQVESSIRTDLARLIGRTRTSWVHEDLLNRVRLVAVRGPLDGLESDRAHALAPISAFLELVGEDGVPLTSAGYLKPEHVVAASALLPEVAAWIGKKNREIDTMPVLWFREAMQKAGLLRKSKGRLLLTKAGASGRHDPEALWRHLVAALPVGKPDTFELHAGLLALLYTAAEVGDPFPAASITEALAVAGWRGSHGPLRSAAVYRATDHTRAVLENLAGQGSAALLATVCLLQRSPR